MNTREGFSRISNGKPETDFVPLLLWRTYRMRRSKGFTVRNAIRDAWRTVRGIY